MKVTKAERALLKPGEKVFEAVVTIRWTAKQDFVQAHRELVQHTNEFRPSDRLDGRIRFAVTFDPEIDR